jgi:hypothetical protein
MNRLTPEEISFFKREGYLVKKGVLDPALMARARDRLWVGAPPSMKRDDPNTWIGPFRPEEENEGGENARKGHSWQYREPAKEELLVRMLVANPVIVGWAEQLLGEGSFDTRERVRGIYCRLPMGDAPEKPLVCHCDVGPDSLHETPFQTLLNPGVGVIGLIASIPPNGGAFTVWPGTHKKIYDLFINTEGLARNDAYKARIIQFNDDRYVDGCGEAGDVLLWHRLLAHTAGWNRSEEIQLREAVLADYAHREDPDAVPKDSYEDMWEDWSEEVRAVAV